MNILEVLNTPMLSLMSTMIVLVGLVAITIIYVRKHGWKGDK